MDNPLSFEEARILGCLLEKEMATPDHYPLTESSLIAACNQSSNREPVVAWEAATVRQGATGLCHRGMALRVHMAGARVPKFKHRIEETFPALERPERALLAVLLLRGPQTAAELRTRTQRLHAFPDAGNVETSLTRLIEHPELPLAVHWPPGSGRRVSTYAHLLCGEPSHCPTASPETIIEPDPDRLAVLEEEVASLRTEVAGLRERFEALESALGGPAPELA